MLGLGKRNDKQQQKCNEHFVEEKIGAQGGQLMLFL